MKQCPSCGTNYTDDTLRFCLSDGASLIENDEQATFVRGGQGPQTAKTATFPDRGQLRVDIPQTTASQGYSGIPPTVETSPSWLKIVVVVGVFAVMIVVAAGIAVALIYFNKDARPAVTDNGQNANRQSPLPTLTPSTSPTAPNSETNELREQIANLEKRLNEQKNANRSPTNIPVPPDQPNVTQSSAIVNSPGDGFLALRTLPSSSAGERIYAIPHGARVFLNGCLATTRVGNKTGRWCRARYGTYNGWVFDAWLAY